MQDKADLLLASANAGESSVEVVDLMYGVAGTSGFYTRSPLERHFRDIQVLKQHVAVSRNRYETVGQVRLGLPPQFPLVKF